MSKRALWLTFGALSVGFVVVSCSSSDGATNFDGTGGENAGGDPSSGATSSTAGKGSTAEAGAGQGEAGSGVAIGGAGTGDAGAPGGGTEPTGGVPGGGGDATFGGAPGEGGGRTGDGGAGGVVRKPCGSVKECDAGQFCMKESCDAQKLGECVDAEKSTPVCGCDGITYYDSTLAGAIDVQGRGVCGDGAVTCDGVCKDGQTCGMVELRGGDCDLKVQGVCWILPKACPLVDLTQYQVCGSAKCMGLCEAVQSGEHAVTAGLGCAIIN